jgi:parallel beta-helix repeat protein
MSKVGKFLALTAAGLLLPYSAGAIQGATRMLYAVPNASFVEQPSGDSVVTISDATGTIVGLQSAIASARSANPNSDIVIRLLSGATYWVTNASVVLGSRECLLATGANIKAASASVTVPLIQINSGSTNVSIAGGTLDGNGAYIQGIFAASVARVNVDKVVVQNCGQDCILLKGNGNSTYDNEMTVTRCDVSGSPTHAGISIQNSTQTAVVDNNCHNNGQGIYLSCAWATVGNNTCHHNTTGIDISGGDDNVVANNTCNNNGTGIHAGASNNMIVSNSMGTNSTVGVSSDGSGNTFVDNLFTGGNASKFTSAGSGNRVVAYKAPLTAASQDYFYPPLIDDQHTNTIVNGMGRTDLTIASTNIDTVQSQYDSARTANPNNVIVLHLNGTFSVGATPLTLQSNSCVLLSGTIQISASTGASAAITGGTSPAHVSISGGIIDGGNLTGNNGVYIPSGTMLQVDAVTLRNFGSDNPRTGGSDVVRFTQGSTPHIVTRCYVNGGSARGIWVENSSAKNVVTDNEVTAVNQDGVDCDASTSGSVVKFNYCHDLVRYGVFIEQSASHNLAFGNICINDGRDINLYNNSATPRGDTAFNSVICNFCIGNNGVRNGSTSTNVVQTSHNFLFNNVVINASISSENYGTQNYYSQTYLSGGSLSTAGTEAFFNSTAVTNQFMQDANSGLAVLVQNAATNTGAEITIDTTTQLGNDHWQLVPTDSGYFKIVNQRSGLVMNVQGASTSPGAKIIQWTFGSAKNDQWMPISAGNGAYYFVNRLSSLYLDVTGASMAAGTQLDQQPLSGGANQQFYLPAALVTGSFSLAASPASQSILAGSNTTFTVTVSTNSSFSGSVNLGLIGLPSGASASFMPPSLTGAGSSTLTVNTTTNLQPGNYPLTINGTNGATVASAAVTLKIISLTGNPGTLVWTNGASNLNWSSLQNWTNITSGGYGPPGASNDVVFSDISSTNAANVTDNIMNSDTTIASLTYSNTNGYHTTQLAVGGELTITGSKGLTVGTETDLGNTASVYDTISGAGAALIVSNTSANIIIRQASANSGGALKATLDLSGLDTFQATIARLELGSLGANPRPCGILYLAQDNTISASGSSPAILIGGSSGGSGNSGNGSYLFLGLNNVINANGITVASVKQTGCSLLFNPASVSGNPSATFRAADGVSRVPAWFIADSGSSGGTVNTSATNDFTGGTVDALISNLTLARSSTGSGTGNPSATLSFATGTIDVGTMAISYQGASSANFSTATVNVNGPGMLIVRTNLEIAHAIGGTGAATTMGTLNVNGGTVQATNILGGGGISIVNLNSGILDMQAGNAFPGRISNVTTLNIGALAASGLALLENAATISATNPITIAPNGTLAGNTFITAPSLIVNGTIDPGIGSAVGAITNSGNVTLGGAGSYVVTVQNAVGLPANGWSLVQAAGKLDVESTANSRFTIRPQSYDPNGSGSVTNFDANANYDWVIAGAGGGVTNFDAAKFTVETSLFQNDLGGGYFYARTNGNSLVLSFANQQSLPVFGSISAGASGVVISGTSGIFGGAYYVLSSTNLMLPLNQWQRVQTNAFAGNGSFVFTNAIDASAGASFYRLELK